MRGARGTGILWVGLVCIAATGVVGLAALGANGALFAAAVGSLALYCLLLGMLLHVAPRFLCISNLFGIAWFVYFPVRLIIIQNDRHEISLHPFVATVSDNELAVIWLLTVLGFAAFVCGVVAVQWRRSPRPTKSVPNMTRGGFLLIAVIGLMVTWLTSLGGVESGILGNAASVYLLGLGGAAFLDARERRRSLVVPLLVGAAVILGVLTGFKATAMLPVIAWALGATLGGLKLSVVRVLAGVVLALTAFTVVQGQRIASSHGDDTGIISATRAGLFDNNLVTGAREQQEDIGAAFTNLFSGVLNRAAGADSLIVIRAKTPSTIDYQDGNTLWQPAASIVPGASGLLKLEFTQLSTGRYFSTEFQSLRPADDPSSQAITMPGDFYLNFGALGVALGMLGIGLLAGFIDRRFPPTSAFGAGVLAYVGTALVSVESNVAFAVVTVGIRLGVVFALIALADIGSRSLRGTPKVDLPSRQGPAGEPMRTP
jgi:hypothetical protein